MVSIEELKELARRLMFDLEEQEYLKLQNEFNILLQQLELIEAIENVDEVEPMVFPFNYGATTFREDEVEPSLKVDEVLKNANDKAANMIKVKKVVI